MLRRFAVLCLAALAAGCTRVAGPAPASGRHAGTVPHVLRIADISDPDHLNPYLSTMDLVYDLSSLTYSYLVVADGSGRLIGDLASEVPSLRNGGISRDGRTYTYHLRRGVLWHDGYPFGARDVLASWHAVLDPRNDTLHREGYDVVSSIQTPDDATVVVHLRKRYPPFVTQFFAPLQEGGKPILPAHVLVRQSDFNTGSLNAHPVGTGPFKFVRWDRGSGIVLARFDRYFKGRPKLDRVELRIVPDDNTILNEVRLHRIDLVVSPPGSLYRQYQNLEGISVELHPWNAQEVLILNSSRPGLHDVAVRRALALAIDTDGLIEKISRGVGTPAYNSLPPTAVGYSALAPHPYDPAAADRLLDDAGWRRGADGVRSKAGTTLTFTIAVVAGSANLRALALQLQSYFQAVGIELLIKPYSYNQIFSYDGPIYGGTYDIAAYSTTLNWDPDVSTYLGCDRWYPKGENTYRFCDPQLDRDEARGLLSEDPAQRAVAYRAASRVIWSEIPYLPLYELRRQTVRSVDLKHFSVNPGATPWYNAWQWDI
ncbi:MAG TPA: peptide ABC transporter substrate-binding protein [Verrucomicrobiae bacterium]|jgi:peptide/nickel transport system substrate-binding protein|nr:peptide ABC transporter substrate-binding protein [Verrucomicrobiae bacterium]